MLHLNHSAQSDMSSCGSVQRRNPERRPSPEEILAKLLPQTIQTSVDISSRRMGELMLAFDGPRRPRLREIMQLMLNEAQEAAQVILPDLIRICSLN